MDKIKFGLFDTFVYTLPGLVLFSTIVLCYVDFDKELINTVSKIFKMGNTLNLNSIFFILIISYVLGFILHYFGYHYYRLIGKRIWKKKLSKLEVSSFSNEQKFAMVRHHSKENFNYVVQWYTYRGMSFNLSLSFLILFFVFLYKLLFYSLYSFDWILITLSFLLFSFVLLRKAIDFHCWSHETLLKTIESLKLGKE